MEQTSILSELSTLFPKCILLSKVELYSSETLRRVLTELKQTPEKERRFTEEQIYDRSFQVRPWSPDIELLEVLRLLHNIRPSAISPF